MCVEKEMALEIIKTHVAKKIFILSYILFINTIWLKYNVLTYHIDFDRPPGVSMSGQKYYFYIIKLCSFIFIYLQFSEDILSYIIIHEVYLIRRTDWTFTNYGRFWALIQWILHSIKTNMHVYFGGTVTINIVIK